MKQFRYFLIALMGLLTTSAWAQWHWTDKDGRPVFSDRAPPTDILEKNILKRPIERAVTPSVSSAGKTNAPQEESNTPKLEGVDKDLMAKKRLSEEAEVNQRKANDEAGVKARVENCARAKQARISYESGVRLARVNEKGEREMVGDADRASELKRIKAIIDTDCK
jgi:hypothetical protein